MSTFIAKTLPMFLRLYEYKDLMLVLIFREFSIRYRHSLLGVLWAVIQPLSMMVLFTFVFTYLLKYGVSGESPKPLFFYAALLPWTFFSSSVTYSINSLRDHQDLITKIYFPREALPLATIMTALVDFLIASVVFIPLLMYYDIAPTVHMLWMIPLFIILFIFTTSVSLVLSSLNVFYRDVQLATRFAIQLLFFGSPILYSVDTLSLKLKLLLFCNPLTYIIENMRRCLIEGRGVVPWQFALVTVLTLVLYYFSYRFFVRTEKAFADVI